jgi:hypothetical protein
MKKVARSINGNRTEPTKLDRFSWDASDVVKITFPDGTVMVGNKVVVAGRDAIVDGDEFIGWTWAAQKASPT